MPRIKIVGLPDNIPSMSDGGYPMMQAPAIKLPPLPAEPKLSGYGYLDKADNGVMLGGGGSLKVSPKLSLNVGANTMGGMNAGLTYKFDEGGEVEDRQETSQEGGQEEQQQGPKMQMVDIERGEILIDPVTLEVIREYKNPKRYKSHASNPYQEPVGNFTFVEEGKVVIPKKYAQRFKDSDRLGRGSILLKILKDQNSKPQETVPAPGNQSVPQAEFGYYDGPDSTDPPKFKIPGNAMDWNGMDASLIPYARKPFPDLMFPGKSGLLPDPSLPNSGGTPFKTAVGKPGTIPYARPDQPGVIQQWETKTRQDFGMPNPNDPNAKVPYARTDGKWMELPKTPDKPGTSGSKLNSLDIARGLNFLPTALGLGFAMQHDPYLKYNEPDFREAESYLQAMPTDVGIEASRSAVNSTNRATNLMLNNYVGPAPRAEIAAGHAAALKTYGELVQNATNMVTESRARKLQALGTLSGQKAQARYNAKQVFEDSLRKDLAARQNMILAGVSEGVTNFGAQVMDNEQVHAINSILDWVKIHPGEALPVADTQKLAMMLDARLNSATLNRIGTKGTTAKTGK